MIAITVILSVVIIALMMELMGPQEKPVYATFSVKAINDTILEIKNTGGNPLPQSSIKVSVNGQEHDGTGLIDINGNDYWDKDEVLYLESLDLSAQVTLIIVSGHSLLLSLDIPGRPSISVIPLVTITPTPVPHYTLPTPPPPRPPAPCPTPVVTPVPTSYVNYLTATYFNDTNWTTPVFSETVNQIMFADHKAVSSSPWITTVDATWPDRQVGRNESFSVIFDGYIHVPADDWYTLYLASDDGSFMHLDGQLIIDNGGYHDYIEKTWTGMLEEGYHPIKVFMFQNTNKSVIHLQFTSTGSVVKQPVTDLWHI